MKKRNVFLQERVHHLKEEVEHQYGTLFRRGKPPGLAAPDHTVPYGTVLSGDGSQALRAWLRSYCPSGTKNILRSEAFIRLALGFPGPCGLLSSMPNKLTLWEVLGVLALSMPQLKGKARRLPYLATKTLLRSREGGLIFLLTMVALKKGYDLAAEVLQLKEQRNAVILAHNYQIPEIQDLADYVGDSLGLSFKAKETDADVIVFCGVHFMAETAKIINPAKKVILPDLEAGCSLSDSCPAESLEKFLLDHAEKNYYVIAYINCSAGVKALSDIICTSGNAVKVVENAPADRNILFVPDQNLGSWVMEKTGRKMDLWRGACYVHVEFTKNSIGMIRERYPMAPVVAHPECTFAVRMLADEICSTEKMVNYCRDSEADAFIIVTESGMLHRLKKEIPGKTFIPGPTENCACADCRFMKKNTLEKLRDALENLAPEILLPEATRRRAELPIIRMLELSR